MAGAVRWELWVKDRLPPPIGDETSAAHTEAVFLVATKETAALRMLSGLDIDLHPVDALPDLRCGVARLPVGAQLWVSRRAEALGTSHFIWCRGESASWS